MRQYKRIQSNLVHDVNKMMSIGMSTASLEIHSYMRQSCTRLEYTDAFSGVCLLFVETTLFELPAAKSSTGYEGGARTITTTPHFVKQWYTGKSCPAHQPHTQDDVVDLSTAQM